MQQAIEELIFSQHQNKGRRPENEAPAHALSDTDVGTQGATRTPCVRSVSLPHVLVQKFDDGVLAEIDLEALHLDLDRFS